MSNVLGQLIVSGENPSEPREGVSVVSQLGTREVVLIATTQHEARCNKEISAWQEKVRVATQAVLDKTEQITKATKEKAVAKLKPLLDKSAEFYAAWGLSYQNEVETEITELGLISAEVHLFSSKRKQYGDSYTYENSNQFTRQFTFAELDLKDEREELEGLKKQQTEYESSLRQWRTALAGMATFERQAQAALAVHALQHDDRGNELVRQLLSAADAQVSELPALTRPVSGATLGIADSRCCEGPATMPMVKARPEPKKRAKSKRK